MDNLIGYRYAFLSRGKSVEVVFWQNNPLKGEGLERVRIKLNKVPAQNRDRYGLKMVEQVNKKLDAGWNYFVEKHKARRFADIVAQYLDEIQRKKRPVTYRVYKGHIDRFTGWLSAYNPKIVFLHQITPEVARLFFEERQKENHVNRTFNNILLNMRSFFNWCIKKNLISVNPFHSISLFPVSEKFRTFISRDDLQKIFKHLGRNDPFYLVICGLCYYGLIRTSEISKIQIFMIDFEKRQIRLPGEITKSRRNKIVVLPDILFAQMEALQYRKAPPEFFIVSHKMRPGPVKLWQTRISDKFRILMDLLGLSKKYTFYSLKDTGSTHMDEAGISGPSIRDQAGWKNMDQRDVYAHATGEALDKLRKFKG